MKKIKVKQVEEIRVQLLWQEQAEVLDLEPRLVEFQELFVSLDSSVLSNFLRVPKNKWTKKKNSRMKSINRKNLN